MAVSAAERIRLLCLDVDGVMTDGGIRIDDAGLETKRFHVRDGTGIRVWQATGGDVAIITGRTSLAVRHRARELGIRHVFQGCADKRATFHQLVNDLGMAPEDAAMLGDDLPDISVLEVCGYPMAVADASPEVIDRAMYVTEAPGGFGAVREAIEHLLRSRGRWDEAVSVFA